MKLKKLLLLCMALLMGIVFSSSFLSQNVKADDVKVVKKLSPNANYPDIKTKLDVSNMSQYADDDLFDSYTLNKFYVKSWGYNTFLKDRHILLTPTKKSSQYFLVVTKVKKVFVGDKITIQGQLNGSSKVNHAQIKDGIDRKYKNKPVTLVLADKIVINK